MESLQKHRSAGRPGSPQLRFSPTAWAKLLFLRNRGMSEVGGFGVARLDDLLYVEDVQTVQQVCSVVTVEFDDAAVARFFDEQVDAGRKPAQFARIWIHTHPEMSALPSGTDEETLTRVFGSADWAVMFILSKTDDVYCRLRFNVGPGGSLEIPVTVDYRHGFSGSNFSAWEAEYQANVRTAVERIKGRQAGGSLKEIIDPQPDQATSARPVDSADAQLREHLELRYGWLPDDIDEQLAVGWTLRDMVESCRHEFDSEPFPDIREDRRTDALFPV
jgi:proteasome lid subunit RPN8/RPN11